MVKLTKRIAAAITLRTQPFSQPDQSEALVGCRRSRI